MSDRSIPISRIVATLMWLTAGALLCGAWVTYFLYGFEEAVLVGMGGCVISAGAATSQVRCYILGVCALVNAYGSAAESRRGPRSLR